MYGFLETVPNINIGICTSQNNYLYPDENSYLTSAVNPRKHLILATLWDPLIPDPAFDRHFASYWMDQLQAESSMHKNGKFISFMPFRYLMPIYDIELILRVF